MKKAIDTIAQAVTFTFDNGLAPVSIKMADVTPECATYAMLHGFAARIGDNAALSRKQADGSIITITEEMRHQAVSEMVTYYTSGAKEWNMRGSAAKAQNPTWLAIAQKRGVSYDVVAAEKAAADLAELQAM